MTRRSLDLSRDTPLAGIVLKMPAPAWIELAGYCGADVLVLDTEHGAGDDTELENHLRAADAVGIPVLVRVPSNDPVAIQSALDAGAIGVVVPHVVTGEDAQRAVAAAHYPPGGTRGLALTTRAGMQGTADLEEHLRRSERDTIIIAQVEDLQGATAIDEIVQVPALSGVWIGLNDLAMSVRGSRDVDAAAEQMRTAQEAVCQAVRGSGKALIMIAPDLTRARYWRDRGTTVLLATAHDLLQGAIRDWVTDMASLTPSG